MQSSLNPWLSLKKFRPLPLPGASLSFVAFFPLLFPVCFYVSACFAQLGSAKGPKKSRVESRAVAVRQDSSCSSVTFDRLTDLKLRVLLRFWAHGRYDQSRVLVHVCRRACVSLMLSRRETIASGPLAPGAIVEVLAVRTCSRARHCMYLHEASDLEPCPSGLVNARLTDTAHTDIHGVAAPLSPAFRRRGHRRAPTPTLQPRHDTQTKLPWESPFLPGSCRTRLGALGNGTCAVTMYYRPRAPHSS